MREEQIIQRLAGFMGHEIDGKYDPRDESLPCKIGTFRFRFKPYENWNHWRQIEEKFLKETSEEWSIFMKFMDLYDNDIGRYLATDLPIRCEDLVSVLPKKDD